MFTGVYILLALAYFVCKSEEATTCSTIVDSTSSSTLLFESPFGCQIGGTDYSLITGTSSHVFDLFGPVSANYPDYTFWSTYISNQNNINMQVNVKMVAATGASVVTSSVDVYIIDSCEGCGSTILAPYPATYFNVNPAAACLAGSCTFCPSGTVHTFTYRFNMATSIPLSPSSQLQIVVNGGTTDFGVYGVDITSVSHGTVQIRNFSNPVVPGCGEFLPQVACGTVSCSNSHSQNSMSHQSQSHYSASNSKQSHSHQSVSHSNSHSRSNSINYGQAENCTTPLNTISFTEVSYNPYYDYILTGLEYSNGQLGHGDKSIYTISQAGTDNCKSFDLIDNPTFNQRRDDPLLLNITRLDSVTHNIAGIVTVDPLFNITITYIGPSIVHIVDYGLPTLLGESYFFDPPYGNSFFRQLEGGGAIDTAQMCDVFQQGSLTKFDYYGYPSPRPRDPSALFGYNGMRCTLLDHGEYPSPNITCDKVCCPGGFGVNCTCEFSTLSCTAEFFQYEDTNSSFSLLEVKIRHISSFGMYIAGIEISNGVEYVPLVFIDSSMTNGTCPHDIRPRPVNFTIPKCCSAGYEEQFNALPPNTLATNLNDGIWHTNGTCPFQRTLTSNTTEFAPFVGISIPMPPNRYAFSILDLTFLIRLSKEHINYFIKQVNQTAGPDLPFVEIPIGMIGHHLPVLYMPAVYYTTQCGEQISACYLGDSSHEMCTLFIQNTWDATAYDTAGRCEILDQLRLNTDNFYILDSPSVNPTINPDQSYMFVVQFSIFDTTPAFLVNNPLLAKMNTTDNLLLNIAWTDFFPGDAVYLASVEFEYDTLDGSPIHGGNGTRPPRITSEVCNAKPIPEAQCGCMNCADQTNTDQTATPVLSYSTSPIMFDDGEILNADGPFLTRRRLMSYNPQVNPDDNLVFPDQVSSNLRLFVNQSNVIEPFDFTGTANQTSTYNIIADNNCGVYISVSECSNNLQVWLSPSQNVSYPDASGVNRFICHVLIPDTVGVLVPLTPNVYMSSWSSSNHFPSTVINSPAATTLYEVSIYTDTVWEDPLMQFSQPAYGFEIPLTQQGPINGIYLFCDMNIFVQDNTSLPLFEGKTVCMANFSGTGVGVSNNTEFFNTTAYATDVNSTIYSFHFMASPQCPAYSMCPQNGWFINNDYSVDISNLGERLRIPNDPLDPNNGTSSSAGVLPYTVEMTIKLNTPEFEAIFNQYIADPVHNEIFAAISVQAPIENTNFLDVDIYTTDGSCAYANICQNVFVNSTFNNTQMNPLAGIAFLTQRVWGDGTKLETLVKPSENYLDVLGIEFVFSSCFLALYQAGYRTTDIAIRMRFSIDPLAYLKFQGQRDLNDVDYTASNQTIGVNQSALDFDGLARRFYLTGMFFGVVTPATAHYFGGFSLPPNLPNSYVLYRPSKTCDRMGFTPMNFCGGACANILERGIMSGTLNISAKAENHPNSTIYDDLLLNSTAINDFLLSIDMLNISAYYNYSNLFIDNPNLGPTPPFYNYDYDYSSGGHHPTPKREYNSDLCNYYIETVAREIAVNGTGYASKQRIPASENIVIDGLLISDFFVASTFKTQLLVQAMNDFGITIAEPFFPGVFVDFDNVTGQVHIMGSALGLSVPLSSNGTSILIPATVYTYKSGGNFYTSNQTYPTLELIFFDMIIPNVTRDMLNSDADLISHAKHFLPGPYFGQGYNPWEVMSCSGYGGPNPCGRDQPYTMKSYSMCNLPVLNLDPLEDVPVIFPDLFVVSKTRNFVQNSEGIIPYQDLLGQDKNITMRMGNGITDSGILGALPVVSSLYTLGIYSYSYMSYYFWVTGNMFPQNGTLLGERFRFSLYPCGTSCPNNATHYLTNHPSFQASKYNVNTNTAPNDSSVFFPEHMFTFNAAYSYAYGNNSNLFYNPLTGNLVGGTAIYYRKSEGRPFHYWALVLNSNQNECFEMLSYATGGNENTLVYESIGLFDPDLSVGLYMNMRDTLGDLQIFGTVCGTNYRFDDSFEVYYAQNIVTMTFGGNATLPNFEPTFAVYPIIRNSINSDLFVNLTFWENAPSGLLPEFASNIVEYDSSATFLLDGVVSFDPAFKNINASFEVLTGYPMTDANVVTLTSAFGANSYTGGIVTYTGGMKMICNDCWNAFDDAAYFDWSNSCTQVAVCQINQTEFPNPPTDPTMIICSSYTGAVCLRDLNQVQTSIGFQWINLALPASYAAKFIMNISFVGPQCILWANTTINGIPLGYDIVNASFAPVQFSIIAPFDGNNVYVIVQVNMLNCEAKLKQVIVNYTNPVNCNPQSYSQSASASQPYSQSRSYTPARNYCCVRNYNFSTFVDPYTPPSQSLSQPLILHGRRADGHHQLKSLNGVVKKAIDEEDTSKAVPHDKMRRATITNSHSHRSNSASAYSNSASAVSNSKSAVSNSASHQSESLSPEWEFQTIYVCDPNPPVSTIHSFVDGISYQVRDEFVPQDVSPFNYNYQHMGMRMGGLWLQFSSDTYGPNATSVRMDYHPNEGIVKISGYTWGVWSLPPNRLSLVAQYNLNDYFAPNVWYFEINYEVGFIVNDTVTREPYGAGGIPFAIQEFDPHTHLPLNVSSSLRNRGIFQNTKYPQMRSRMSASNLEKGVYVPELNPIIDSFNSSFVQMMILSGLNTSLGQTGWFGIGQLNAWACINYTWPHFDYELYPDFGDRAVETIFNHFLCINDRDYGEDINDYYVPRSNITLGIGEFMFVVESDCPVSNSESQSASHYSESQSQVNNNHNHHHRLLPTWAMGLLIGGVPFLIMVLIIWCALAAAADRRRRRENRNSERMVLLPVEAFTATNYSHAQHNPSKQTPRAMQPQPPVTYALKYNKDSQYYNNKKQ